MIDDTKEFYKVLYKEYKEAVEKQQRKDAELIPILSTPPEAKRY